MTASAGMRRWHLALAGPAVSAMAAPAAAQDLGLAAERLHSWGEGFVRMLPNFVAAAAALALAFGIAALTRRLVRLWAGRRARENLGEVLGGFVRWTIVFVGVLIAMVIVLPSFRPADLLAGLGVGSVAIGFAFKDILQNWLAGLLLLLRQPFAVGDQIVVREFEGTVVRIETRATDIRTYDGRRVLDPNSEVYTNTVVVNTAYPKRRSELDVGIGYGDDIELARKVIMEVLADVPGIERDPPPEVLPWDLAGSAVTLKVWWWSDSRRLDVMRVRAAVVERLKAAFGAAGIDLPFETVVQLWHDQTEEWDGVRGRQREGWPKPPDSAAVPRPARETAPHGPRRPG
ncbi:MAG: mechanosensitive ion channel family protein [Alphaproteobacteria bacterium]